MKEIIIQILTILGILSIPSITWNIFLYRQNKKYRNWDAGKNLKKLNIQRGIIESEFDDKSKNLALDYENRRYADFDTDSERFNAWEKEQGLLQERKNDDLGRIDADIDYFEKISGQKNYFIFSSKETWLEKIKRKLNELWQNAKQKNSRQ